MLKGCEFKSIKYALVFETMQFFLQRCETRRASSLKTSACDVSFINIGLLYKFFKIWYPSLKKSGCVPTANRCISLFAFNHKLLFLRIVSQILKACAPSNKKKVGYRRPRPKSLEIAYINSGRNYK